MDSDHEDSQPTKKKRKRPGTGGNKSRQSQKSKKVHKKRELSQLTDTQQAREERLARDIARKAKHRENESAEASQRRRDLDAARTALRRGKKRKHGQTSTTAVDSDNGSDVDLIDNDNDSESDLNNETFSSVLNNTFVDESFPSTASTERNGDELVLSGAHSSHSASLLVSQQLVDMEVQNSTQQVLIPTSVQHPTTTRAHIDAAERRRRLVGNNNRVPRTHNIARRPLDPFEPEPAPHYIGRLNVVCEHCQSLSFPSDKFKCCHNGKVDLTTHPFPPELQELFTADSELAKNFLKNIRRINTAFAFASHPSKLEAPPPGRGPPVFRVHGQMYHYYASLHPNGDAAPCFNQLYIYQPSEANRRRLLNTVTGGCSPEVMEIIANFIHNHNPYARAYRTMHEVEIRAEQTASAEG